MPQISRPILVVSYVDATLELLVKSLLQLDISAVPCNAFCDSEKLALENTYNGILIDLTSIIKAKGEEKVVAYGLASVYPSLRVRSMGAMLIPMAMPGDAKQDNSLKDFIYKTCAEFAPRSLRLYRRRDKCVSIIRKDIPGDERGFTLNISWGGAFIIDNHSERFTVGQKMTFLLHELGLEVNVVVCWIQAWGHRHFPGIGVRFETVDEELEKALFQLLKHDRSIDRDRITS
jgi:PilZ domain